MRGLSAAAAHAVCWSSRTAKQVATPLGWITALPHMKKTQVSRARRELASSQEKPCPEAGAFRPSCPGVRGCACRTGLEGVGEAGEAREPQPPGLGEPGEEWEG